MKNISDKAYLKANDRLEELLKQVSNDTPYDSPLLLELSDVSDVIEQYEEIHYPIELPTLNEMIELRMFEMNLKRKDLAELLNTSASRVSEYLNGKREITLKVAKDLHKKLNIDAEIILQ
ncbi:helix-turn-helix domain-containing protein [Cryomorpha ignava]|uniref:Helix-turn-helix domain-containing protein n=1 Tax=Cryomorpha ignava TaxID=101383 RepID=A0A7K3WLZ2_9FLAO|nr:helix-turn-helix domain-containing protein [Cryomorpha ignava]NEN21912.1 helix-turn-helix domain-containing protein [Cryomorpha ignava]